MDLPLGYLKQFIQLYGITSGLKLFNNLRSGNLKSLTIPTLNDPFELRDNNVDFRVFCQIFVHNEYNVQIDFEPCRVIDAGANIGLFTRYINAKYPKAAICSIEPDSDNFELLQTNTSIMPNKTLLKKGLWSKVTKLDISDPYKSGKWAMMVNEDANGSVESIDVPEIMKMLNWEQIDLFKIDIEGSEKELFAENYEDWLPKTRILIIELHDWMKPGCTSNFFKALNKCVDNYSMSIHGENLVIVNHELTPS